MQEKTRKNVRRLYFQKIIQGIWKSHPGLPTYNWNDISHTKTAVSGKNVFRGMPPLFICYMPYALRMVSLRKSSSR